MTTARQLDKIATGPGTKADRARALYELGCDRTDVVELLSMSYSQAHSIWKEFDHAAQGDRVRVVREKGRAINGSEDQSNRRALRLSPAQTRYITQDGHVILRVDKDTGAECIECGKLVTFSLRWLGFVHTRSKADPTKIEDHYK